jgi:hypothetical protein
MLLKYAARPVVVGRPHFENWSIPWDASNQFACSIRCIGFYPICVLACKVTNIRVGREEKTNVKVEKAVENWVVCVTVHMNITQTIIVTLRDWIFQSIPLNRRLYERQSRSGRFEETNLSPAGNRTMIPRSLQHLVNKYLPACWLDVAT